jgi:hypothetical protein
MLPRKAPAQLCKNLVPQAVGSPARKGAQRAAKKLKFFATL